MTNDARKTSQLPRATSLSANDRLVVLTNPATSAQTQTVTLRTLSNNIVRANTTTFGTVKVGNNLSVNATGYLNSGAANTGSWTFDGTKANTGGSQNSFIDGQSPGGLLLYNDYEVTLLANNAYFEFNQDFKLISTISSTLHSSCKK